MIRAYDFINGPTTAETPTVGTPSDDADLITKGFADGAYVQGSAACANPTAVRAIGASDRAEGDLVYCISVDRIFRFDADAVGVDDGFTILTPSSGSGRWLIVRQGLTGVFVGTTDSQVITTKQFDSSCVFIDASVASKRMAVSLAGSTSSTTATLTFATTANRAYTFPDADMTVAGTATTQTLSNKSFSGNTSVLAAGAFRFYDNDGSNYAGIKANGTTTADVDYTLPAAPPGTDGFALTSTTLGVMAWSAVLTNPMDGAGQIIYGGASGTPTKLVAGTSTQLFMSNGTSAPAWTSQIKTGVTFEHTSGTARRMAVSLSGSTDSTTATLTFATTASRAYTFPDADLTVVGTSTSQTLSNKAFSSSVLVSYATVGGLSEIAITNTDNTDFAAAQFKAVSGSGNTVRLHAVGSGQSSAKLTNGLTGAQGILFTDSGPLAFGSNGNYVGHIDSGGNWFLGASASVANSHTIRNNTTAANTLTVRNHDTSTGSDSVSAIRIIKGSTTSTTAQVFILFNRNAGSSDNGSITAATSTTLQFTAASDERLKQNIRDLPSQLDNILAMRPVLFDMRDGSGDDQPGFIAQEMREIYPDVISEGRDGYLRITGWDLTTARLVSAMQGLHAMIESLQAQVDALAG